MVAFYPTLAEPYNHESDPAEMVNLAKKPEHAGSVAELSKQVRARILEANRKPEAVAQIVFDNRRTEE